MIVSDDSWATFPADMLPKLFRVVDAAWQEIVPVVESDPSDRPDEKKKHENRISRRLIVKMREKAACWPLHIDRIDSQQEILDKHSEIGGYIDVFIARHEPDAVSFTFEAKRLNHRNSQGRWSSEAGPYVTDGMSRFISGQYAAGQTTGGMLGYVLDGDVARAQTAIEDKIDKEREALRLRAGETFRFSAVLPGTDHIRESHHELDQERRFIIHHLFLANHNSENGGRN